MPPDFDSPKLDRRPRPGAIAEALGILAIAATILGNAALVLEFIIKFVGK